MKLIKTTSSSTRTSQACDRCRIKKIKCDGSLPSCSNCLKIGYNCQISDKLTRRAFPRGYTENLEKNLINLQNEIIKLNEEISSIKDNSTSPTATVKSKPAVTSEKDLSQSFFKYNNYVQKQQYIGLNSLQVIFNNYLISFGLNPKEIKESKDDNIDSFIFYDSQIFIVEKFLKHLPSKHNLDIIIQKHFQIFNKLIPIINEAEFFEVYKQSIDSQLLQKYGRSDVLPPINGNDLDIMNHHDFIIQLILIIQLNCSIFSIHDIHKLITNQLNVISSPNLIKFENLLLSLWLFHNKNCYSSTVVTISNLLKSMCLNLGLHLNYNNLINFDDSRISKETNFKIYSHRLKLYWCFHILNRLTSILSGLPDFNFFGEFQIPKLSSLKNFNDDLKIPLKLIELLDIDWNLLKNYGEDANSAQYSTFLNNWIATIDTDEYLEGFNDLLRYQLKAFGLIFQILLNFDNSSKREVSVSFLKLIEKLNIMKESGLNSFEFHSIPLNFVKIIIISMFNLINHDGMNDDPQNSQLIKNVIFNAIKPRYPENFFLFKNVLNLILSKSTNDDYIDSNRSISNSTPLSERESLSLSSTNPNYQSLFNNRQSFSTPKITENRNYSIASSSSIESILSNRHHSLSTNSITSSLNNNNNTNELEVSNPLNIDQQKIFMFDWTNNNQKPSDLRTPTDQKSLENVSPSVQLNSGTLANVGFF